VAKSEEPLDVECCESENQGIGEEHLGSMEISTIIDFNDVTRNLSFVHVGLGQAFCWTHSVKPGKGSLQQKSSRQA
jgi:hypothetical protein